MLTEVMAAMATAVAVAVVAAPYASAAGPVALVAESQSSRSLGESATAKPPSSMEELLRFAYVGFQVGMVFGPQLGYFCQWRKIVREQHAEGYSPFVSLILLASNTLRVYYFIGHHFAIALLFQAFVAVAMHLVLVHEVLLVHEGARNRGGRADPGPAVAIASPAGGEPVTSYKTLGSDGSSAVARGPRSDSVVAPAGADPAVTCRDANDIVVIAEEPLSGRSNLWIFRWERRIEEAVYALPPQWFLCMYGVCSGIALGVVMFYYSVFLLVLPSVLRSHGTRGSGGTTFHTSHFTWAPEVVGYTALFIEAQLVTPQILLNFRRRSTLGLLWVVVLVWVVGDAVKIVYFLFAHQPLPFIVCGGFQLSMDFVVVAQIMYYDYYVPYRRRAAERRQFLSTMLSDSSETGSDGPAVMRS